MLGRGWSGGVVEENCYKLTKITIQTKVPKGSVFDYTSWAQVEWLRACLHGGERGLDYIGPYMKESVSVKCWLFVFTMLPQSNIEAHDRRKSGDGLAVATLPRNLVGTIAHWPRSDINVHIKQIGIDPTSNQQKQHQIKYSVQRQIKLNKSSNMEFELAQAIFESNSNRSINIRIKPKSNHIN